MPMSPLNAPVAARPSGRSPSSRSVRATLPACARPTRGSAGPDAVVVRVLRVGAGDDLSLGDGFEQPDAEHDGRDAGGDAHVVRQRSVRGVDDLVARGEERVPRAVRVPTGHFARRDPDLALGLCARDRPVLELAAVLRIGHDLTVRPGADHAEPQQQAARVVGMLGGFCAPSRKWHVEHDCAFISGPSPSRSFCLTWAR